MRLVRSRLALWVMFLVVHGWLTYLGVGPARGRSFGDVDLYRRWADSGVVHGVWPGLDAPWVYPVGAWVPILVPAVVSVTATTAYMIAWCIQVTVLNGVAMAALVRTSTRPTPAGSSPEADPNPDAELEPALSGPVAAWGWLAFLAALGPVAIGRLDAIIAPIMILALLVATRHPRVASALLTFGAWVKVAPGALIIAVAAAAKRPIRDVVAPAAAVCVVVVGTTAALGGLSYLTGFLNDQGNRGLQIEAVGASPFVLAATFTRHVHASYNRGLVTYEIAGPGTGIAATTLDVLFAVVVIGIAVLLLWARRRGADVLLPGALALAAALIVTNKVGSPQYMMWLAPAVAVGIATRARGPWLRLGGLLFVIALMTQVVYPWQYGRLLRAEPWISALLAARNLGVTVLLVVAITTVVRTIRAQPEPPHAPAGPTRARSADQVPIG